jgi:hypothetical protein
MRCFTLLVLVSLAMGVSAGRAELLPFGVFSDEQTSIVYRPETGEMAIDAPQSTKLTSYVIYSNSGIFGLDCDPWAGCEPISIFRTTFGSRYGSHSLGNVAQPGLTQGFIVSDLWAVGSLDGGGDLGAVDLVYMHDLYPGDANRDFAFDQLDIVRVQQAGKYLTGQPATWGDGNWNGGPGGYPGEPPVGDGFFSQLDIVAALQTGDYLRGPYAAIRASGVRGDDQTSIIYDARTGGIAVDPPAGVELTCIDIVSASEIFTGEPAQNLHRG